MASRTSPLRACCAARRRGKALQLEDALGDLGTSIATTVNRDDARLELEVLKRYLGAAVALLADVARNPTFPVEEIEREKKTHLDSLAQQARNANAIAARGRPILVFSAAHPYGRPIQGFPSTVEALTPADLAAFHAARWKPGSSALVFSGDITLDQARSVAEKAFGGWSGGAAASVEIPAPSPAAAGRVYLIDRQDAAQTFVTQFLPAPARQSDDFPSLALADAVWGGGGFGTRLNLNLRQNKGYSYGVFSNLALFRDGGMWYSNGGVQTNKTKESLVEFDKELAGSRPITDEEFASARLTRIRGYAQQFEALSRVNGQIGDLWTDGLPMTVLQRDYDDAVKATVAQARRREEVRAVQKGKRAPGRRPLEDRTGILELHPGKVVLLDAEGKVVE